MDKILSNASTVQDLQAVGKGLGSANPKMLRDTISALKTLSTQDVVATLGNSPVPRSVVIVYIKIMY